MKELVLLVEPAKEPSVPSPASGQGQAVAHWSAWEVPEGRISLPARLHADLVAIRAEHAAWAYDLGRLRVGRKELQEKLKAGESLSMWWCSPLYERHPRMTPNLYTIYKLRALERLMDEEAFTALRLCGGDATLRHTLADFCAVSGRLFVECHEPGTAPQARAKPAAANLQRLPRALAGRGPLCALVVDRTTQTALRAYRHNLPHAEARVRAAKHGRHRYLFPQSGHARRRSGTLPLPLLGKAARRS